MNPYDVLQIKPEASAEEIMTAYLRLAQQWHPDRFTGQEKLVAAMRYKELAEAFTKLKGIGGSKAAPQAPAPAMPPPVPPASAPRIELSPASDPALAVAAPALYESQKIRIQTEAEIADSAPRSEQTLYAKAKTAFEKGQSQTALDHITEAIRLDPEVYEQYALQVKILEGMEGEKRTLVAALEHCLRLNKKDADSAIHIAQIYHSLGMQTRATRHWEWAYNHSPNHPIY